MNKTKRDIDSPLGVLADLCQVGAVCLILLVVAMVFLGLLWLSVMGIPA